LGIGHRLSLIQPHEAAINLALELWTVVSTAYDSARINASRAV